jgi:hypothetical protein
MLPSVVESLWGELGSPSGKRRVLLRRFARAKVNVALSQPAGSHPGPCADFVHGAHVPCRPQRQRGNPIELAWFSC